MNEELKRLMREILLDRYGVDISGAVVHFSTQNYAFIFPGQPYMIRVSMTPKKSREQIVSELMWVDDLKRVKQTICEPNLSLNGKILEEFEIDGVTYRASMFRTARGNVQETVAMTPMFFVCVGELLGTIHEVSTDEREIGMHYKRPTLAEIFAAQKEKVAEKLDPAMLAKIDEVEAAVNALPDTLGEYGICHGDFHINNFFVEANNVWLFDFDGCCYARYLYDIASFVESCFLQGYGAGKDCRKVLEEEMLPYFRYGYALGHGTEEDFWKELDLFLRYRAAFTILMLAEVESFGGAGSLEQIRGFFSYIFMAPDFLDAVTASMSNAAGH